MSAKRQQGEAYRQWLFLESGQANTPRHDAGGAGGADGGTEPAATEEQQALTPDHS